MTPNIRRMRTWALWIAGALSLLLLSGWALQTFHWERQSERFDAPGRLVTVDDGRRIHLVCRGEGAPTVVMDAGGTHDSTQYVDLSAEQLRDAPPLRADVPLVVVTRDAALGDVSDATLEAAWHHAQAAAAARSSRGELIVATGSGHHVTEDRPDVAAEAIFRAIEGR